MSLKSAWIDFLYKSATGTKKVRTLLTPIGAIIFGLFVLIFILIAVQIDTLLNLPNFLNFPMNLIIAIPLVFLGIILTGWSVLHFLKSKGTPVPANPPPTLVNTGPYLYSRNPMLSGIFFLMFGIGFWISSLSLVLIFTPLFIIVNTLELKKIEEPELEKRLGKDYVEYREKTPMYLLSLIYSRKAKINKD